MRIYIICDLHFFFFFFGVLNNHLINENQYLSSTSPLGISLCNFLHSNFKLHRSFNSNGHSNFLFFFFFYQSNVLVILFVRPKDLSSRTCTIIVCRALVYRKRLFAVNNKREMGKNSNDSRKKKIDQRKRASPYLSAGVSKLV